MTRADRSRHMTPFVTTCARLVLGSAIFATPALASDWYVDGAFGSLTGLGTQSSPFLKFYQANIVAQPGDNIYLEPTTTYSTLWIGASGASGSPITISGTGVAPNLTKVSGMGKNFGISIGGSYIVLKNLDVTAPGIYSVIKVPANQHHIQISNNVIHDGGGNGVDTIGNDYVTISYNVVYGNGKNTSIGNFGSGISIKGGIAVDASTAPKFQVIGNIVYANTNTPTCGAGGCSKTITDSDGSGIIVDKQRRTGIDDKPYTGWTLVADNVVFGNGGRGIHMYLSDRILVNGNTSFWNNQDPYEGNFMPGEIEANDVSAVIITNNVAYSDGVGASNASRTGPHEPISVRDCTEGDGPIVIDHNLGYRPTNDAGSFLSQRYNTGSVQSYNNVWGNPWFERATIDPTLANFHVVAGSLALGNGTSTNVMPVDIVGAARGLPSTIGAYENAIP